MASAKGKIIIITAPSGSGKTSITRHLMDCFVNRLTFSVSATTRPKREYEVDGVHYHFISTDAFNEKIAKNEFVEWEMVYEGKYYGTLLSELENAWKKNLVPVLDIDVHGAVHVQQQFPGTSLSIFIEPPSIEELRDRLEKRGSETPESLNARINKASYELSFKFHFNFVVVNDNLESACKEAEKIVKKFLDS